MLLFTCFCLFIFLKIYNGYYHELLNEDKERAEVVVRDIVQWISDRIPQAVN